VIAAVESGQRVVLTVHGRPVADIVPRVARSEGRPTAVFLAELEEIRDFAVLPTLAPDLRVKRG
jgi:antitoxin (DNA-binding transcriptional repressor) of toxin-antitoxin stability system